METFLRLLRTRPLLVGVVVVALVAGAVVLLSGNGRSQGEFLTVAPGDFVQEVSVSGKVIAAQEVDLAFPESGRVASIAVEVGDTVGAGASLASLASGTLISELRAAEANLVLQRAKARNTTVNLDEVRREQDTLVASAYRDLLSDGLAAVPVSSYATQPPTITGLYEGPEGTYRINIDRKANSQDRELQTFGLEQTGPVTILDDEPTHLGTRGLFIAFPDDMSSYDDTTWEVTIPNKKSASYLANYNAYQEALRTRDRRLAEAESELRAGSSGSVAEAEIQQAEAEVARMQAAIAERTLRAPFTGVVTAVHAKLGSTMAPNEPAISMISAGALQIESYVPEINIPLIEVGDAAMVTLDAYGADVEFAARVVSIDPAETERDGVSTYRIILQFEDRDERVRSGMTANVVITTDERKGVLSVPRGAVQEREGKKYVRVKIDGSIEEREVATGAVSSLGNVEVLLGLSSGDVVVLFE